MKPAIYGAVAIFALVLAGIAGPQAAQAAVQATLYASAAGSGTLCTSAAPCSLSTAKSRAESLAPNATGDINVVLAGGTYALSSTLTFTSADSAANGHLVTYAASPGANVLFTGGTSITGWSLHDSTKNIWQATVPSGLNTRQIYVNGVRSGIDTMNTLSVFGPMTKTSTGYTFTSTGPNSWTNTANVTLVYPGAIANSGANPWMDSMCPTSSIASGVITMQNPCFLLGTSGRHDDNPSINTYMTMGTPTAVQNNYALLGQPGQFYIDPTTNTMYYVPRAGETMSTANVIAPQLQTMLAVNGTAASPVTNLSFQGIQFSYAAWTFGNLGVLDSQANSLVGATATQPYLLPAAVQCHSCTSVSFTANTFSHLGDSGLALDGGGSNNLVKGNIFTDISANGVNDGMTDGSLTFQSGDVITDNEVDNVANEYLGGVGIFAGFVKNTSISHNEVWNVPYTGISLGYGWGLVSGMVNNHVDYNYVHNVMNSALRDGGEIYLNGTQGATPASSLQGNYVVETSQDYAALYLDNGASYWNVINNVVGGFATHWLFLQTGDQGSSHNNVTSNYAASTAGPEFQSTEGTNAVYGNFTGLTVTPAAAQAIVANAGLEPAYVALGGAPQANLAYGKTPVVSSSYSGLAPTNSTDGYSSSLWSTAAGDSAPSWQIDLGAAYPLSAVQIMFRMDGYDALSDGTNITIAVSNSPSLSSGYTVACTLGATPLPIQTRLDCPAPAGSWRYVSIFKTDTSPLVFAEARIFGTDNLAAGQTASSSSVYSASFPASNAVDRNSSSLFASASGAGQWWRVGLPAARNLSQVQVQFRNDGYDYPSERQNFAIWVSTSATFATYTVACVVGTTPLAYGSTYTCSLPPGQWQYVELAKSDSSAIVAAEIRVLGL